ncbi:MAG: Rieske 2Fe-2S domain-containing protein [Myxococcota bacterium]
MVLMPRNAWYAVAHCGAVSSPVAVVLFDLAVVLFRGDSGVVAFVDRCPHRHAALSGGSVVGGQIRCGYHGWRFDDSGACTDIPGLMGGSCDTPARRLTPVPCVEAEGLVWIGVGEPPGAVPPVQTRSSGPGIVCLNWSFFVQCDPVDAIENFLDPMHTHFIHSGLVRTDGARRSVPVRVQSIEGGVEAVYSEAQQSGRIARWFGADIVESYGRYLWPGLAQLGYRDARGVERMTITASFVPTEAGVAVTAVVAGAPPGWVPPWAARALIGPFLRRTVEQDRRVLEQVASARREGAPAYAMSPVDLLRPHIERRLRDPSRPSPVSPSDLVVEL